MNHLENHEKPKDITTPVWDAFLVELKAMRTDIGTLTTRLDSTNTDVAAKLQSLTNSVEGLKASVQYAHEQLEQVLEEVLPEVLQHSAKVQVASAHAGLERDVWARKWNRHQG